MSVGQLKSAPLPKNCPRCGDVVKWSREQAALNPDAAVTGAPFYQFHVSCSKSESMSTQGLHGSCTWGFSAPGYFGKDGQPFTLQKAAKWTPYDDALLAKWPLADKAKGEPDIALVLRPRDVAALHGLLLALEKVPRSQLQPILGDWQNFAALVGLLPLTRAAVKPAGAPMRLTLRLKKPNQR